MNIKKKILIVAIVFIVIIILLSLIKYIYIMHIKSNYIYIGKEYCYTGDASSPSSKRYYYFYYNSSNNSFVCIKNDSKVIKITNIEELEYLYITEINTMVIGKTSGKITYDENDNEISSSELKNKMFPNEESNYWDFEDD